MTNWELIRRLVELDSDLKDGQILIRMKDTEVVYSPTSAEIEEDSIIIEGIPVDREEKVSVEEAEAVEDNGSSEKPSEELSSEKEELTLEDSENRPKRGRRKKEEVAEEA